MALSQTEIEVLLRMRAEGAQAIDLFSGTLGKANSAGQAAAGGVDQASSAFKRNEVAAVAAGVAVGEFATKLGEKLVELGKDTVLTAARTEGLTAVAEYLGQKTGRTKDEVDSLIGSIKHQGVTTQEASNLVIQLSRANLGLENATKLATVAQNGAFIAGESTAEALGQIITGVVTLQPELIRSAGITVSLQQAENEYARAMHKTTEALTTQEKQQLLLQAVLKEGDHINGVYALSMQYVGKQLTSLPRYIEEAKNAVGTELLPVLGLAVTGFTDLLKIITAHPGIFVNLGVAVTAVVGPLLAAKAAAFLGIPTFAELASVVTRSASALEVLAGVRTFGDLRAGIQLIGEAAGITYAKLGVLGTGAAVAAAAFAGWEFGRWIAGLTSMDEKVASLAARLLGYGDLAKETAGAKQDTINLAIQRGADASVTFSQALEFNTDWLKRHNAEAGRDEAAVNRLRAEQEHFSVTLDGVNVRVGTATDSLHKYWDAINNRQLKTPTLPNLPTLPGAERGPTLDPAKDAMDFLTASMEGNATVAKVLVTRAHEVNQALILMGHEGVAAAKTALDSHVLSAKDLADAYKIDVTVANALIQKWKDEGEAAKTAADKRAKVLEAVRKIEQANNAYTLEGFDKLNQAGVKRNEAEMAGRLKTLELVKKIEGEKTEFTLEGFAQISQAGVRENFAELGRLKVTADAYRTNAEIITSVQGELNARIREKTSQTVAEQIAAVRKWQDLQEGAINYSVDNWKTGYDAIAKLADEKVRDIVKAHDPIFQAFASLAETTKTLRTAIDGTFAQMILGAKGFKDGFLDIWSSLKAGVQRILAELLNSFVTDFLDGIIGAMTGKGGRGGGFTQVFAGLFGGFGGGAPGAPGVGGGAGLLGGLFGRGTPGQVYLGTGSFNEAGEWVTSGSGASGGMGNLARFGGGGIMAATGVLELLRAQGKLSNTLAGAQTGAGIGTMIAPGIGTLIGAGLGAFGGFLKGAFGGPSKDERDGRMSVADFQQSTLAGLTPDQLKEAQGAGWSDVSGAATAIALRDAYLAVGKTAEQAQLDLKALWDSEKKGPTAVTAAMQPLLAALQQQQQLLTAADAALQKYGFTWLDLGEKAKQSHVDDELKGLQAETDALVKKGLDQVAVLDHMSGAYSAYVQDVIRSGSTIPEALRPTLQTLIDLGKLVDANGDKISDLAQLSFAGLGNAARDAVDDVNDQLGRLKSPDVTIKYKFDQPPADLPPQFQPDQYDYTNPGWRGDGGETEPVYAASGIFASRPTLAWFGEGGQAEVGGSKEFFVDVFSKLAGGNRATASDRDESSTITPSSPVAIFVINGDRDPNSILAKLPKALRDDPQLVEALRVHLRIPAGVWS